MAVRHTISHADTFFYGNARKNFLFNAKRGVPFSFITQVSLGTPVLLSATAVVTAAAASGTTPLTLVTTAVATGTNYGRALKTVSTDAGDTTQTLTVLGKNYLGETMSELFTLNGTSTVTGKKAFYTVTSITPSATTTGNVTVGTTDLLGLPYVLTDLYDIIAKYVDTTIEAMTVGTVAKAVTTSPATTTTGDVRGTWLPNTASNGSRVYRIWYKVGGVANETQAYGVTDV